MEEVAHWVKVENLGSIHLDNLTIVGKSPKRGDDKTIGEFGSGLKHWLAWAEHTGIQYAVFNGMHCFDIKTMTVPYAGHDETKLFVIDGKQTTTSAEWSHQWSAMMALREVVANAIDSSLDGGNYEISVVTDIEPVPGFVQVYMQMIPELNEVMGNLSKLFCVDRVPIIEDEDIQVFSALGDGGNVYYRGMRCVDMDGKSIFDYNLKTGQINEERMLRSDIYLNDRFTKVVMESLPMDSLLYFLSKCCYAGFRDNLYSLSTSLCTRVSDAWKELSTIKTLVPFEISEYVDKKGLVVPKILILYLKNKGVKVKTPFDNDNIEYVEDGGFVPPVYIQNLCRELVSLSGKEPLEWILVRSTDSIIHVNNNKFYLTSNISPSSMVDKLFRHYGENTYFMSKALMWYIKAKYS